MMYRRSRKDYPRGVLGIYDNAGQRNESIDHYTIVFEPFIYDGRKMFPTYTMSDHPSAPWGGVCGHADIPYRVTGGWQSGATSAGKTINYADLPQDCKAMVESILAVEECA